MLRNLLGGIAVGIANIIPGVSGGTMMVILGIFNPINEAVTNLFKRHNPNRKKDILFLLQVLLGAGIGLVGFANVLTYCFDHFPTQTMWWFVGLVGFSIPVFKKNELKEEKIHIVALLAGILIIALISYLAPIQSHEFNPAFPDISLFYLIKMVLLGIIAGGTMLLPGVSGSMVLLILGEYYLFKSLVANVLTFQLNVVVPLCFLAIGILLGILLAARLIQTAMAKNARVTLSFLLGLILASTILLIPFDVSYNMSTIMTCLFAFGFGGIVVYLIEKFA